MLDVAALRAAVARPVPPVEPYGPADELRRRLVPSWDARRAAELGETSAYASGVSTAPLVRGAGVSMEAAPRCGDCGARRAATGTCASCGSTQPASLAAMNPRAARIIGQAPYR